MKKTITKEMPIQEIFNSFPDKKGEIAEILMSVGLGCIGCALAQFETLEQGLLAHGKSPKEIASIINSLNSVISK
jgi:hybrid cluster-associated redox disulfide protein